MRVNNRSLFKTRPRGSYRVENKADEATVYLYDEISFWGISANDFVKDLNDIKASTIHLRINSPGGSVFDGIAIYNAIKQHKSKIVAHIDGLAASIASVVAMSASEVRIGDNAFLMIHEPWSMVAGTSSMMRDEADLLDKVAGTIARTYSEKSGKEESEILDYMAAETWFTAEEALKNGFVDAIDKESNSKAQAGLFDLTVFANVPDSLKENKPLPTIRELEHLLQGAGFSEGEAKGILAKGFSQFQREAGIVEEPGPTVPQAQREAEPDQREAGVAKEAKKDRVSSLLMRAATISTAQKKGEKTA